MQLCHRLLGIAFAVLVLGFAPIPPPRTGIAEAVVLGVGTSPAQLRQQFRDHYLPLVLRTERGKGLACLRGEKMPGVWLATHLKVEEATPAGAVRLRLEGGRPEDVLALLTALVEAYESKHRLTHLRAQEEVLVAAQLRVRVLAAQQAGGIAPVLMATRAMDQQGRAVVLQRPKLVSTTRTR